MSEACADFDISIGDEGEERNCELASKMFEWFEENFDWFADGCRKENIYLEENLISAMCVYENDTSGERGLLDCLKKAFEKFHPEQMHVDIEFCNPDAFEDFPCLDCKLVRMSVKGSKLTKGNIFHFVRYINYDDESVFSYLPDEPRAYMLGDDFKDNPDSRTMLCLRKGDKIIKKGVELWPLSLRGEEDKIQFLIGEGNFCLTICGTKIPLLNAAGHLVNSFRKMDVAKTFRGTDYEGCEFLGIQHNKDEEPVPLEFEEDFSNPGDGPDFSEEHVACQQFTLEPVVAKDHDHLRKLIELAIKKYGPECDLNFIDVSHMTDMNGMFVGLIFKGNISQWNVSNVTNMHHMFADSPFNGDISKWNVSRVENMACMFNFAEFNGDISQWNVSHVTNMDHMFCGLNFNGDISQWDVSNVTNMDHMFANSPFNGNISKWNVSRVENMNGMFQNSKFDGNIDNWVVCAKHMKNIFAGSVLKQTGKFPKWYTDMQNKKKSAKTPSEESLQINLFG